AQAAAIIIFAQMQGHRHAAVAHRRIKIVSVWPEEPALVAGIKPDLVNFTVRHFKPEYFFKFREEAARQFFIDFRQQFSLHDKVGTDFDIGLVSVRFLAAYRAVKGAALPESFDTPGAEFRRK